MSLNSSPGETAQLLNYQQGIFSAFEQRQGNCHLGVDGVEEGALGAEATVKVCVTSSRDLVLLAIHCPILGALEFLLAQKQHHHIFSHLLRMFSLFELLRPTFMGPLYLSTSPIFLS